MKMIDLVSYDWEAKRFTVTCPFCGVEVVAERKEKKIDVVKRCPHISTLDIRNWTATFEVSD